MNVKVGLPLFHVLFEDKTIPVFRGGTNYFETKWKEIPYNKIARIFYLLPSGDHLTLSGYDKYYHMTEATQELSGKLKGQTRLAYDYIMGKKDGKIRCYKIVLSGNQFGNVIISKYDETEEFIQKLNPNGWR